MEESTLSCQLTLYPLGTGDINQEVKVVLELVQNSPVEAFTNELSTNLYGQPHELFALLQQISAVLSQRGTYFAMSLHISNYCGCEVEEL